MNTKELEELRQKVWQFMNYIKDKDLNPAGTLRTTETFYEVILREQSMQNHFNSTEDKIST